MITSTQNPKIRWVRSLQARGRVRREEGVFVVEGVRLVEEALQAGWTARLVLHSSEVSARGAAVVEGFTERGVPVEQVTEIVLRAASETQSPQGILAVLEMQRRPMPEGLDFVLVADGVRDPGNLGAILRTAAAAGVQAVLLPPGVVDAYAPKVVRAAMGAHFRLTATQMSWEEIKAMLQPIDRPALRVYLADASEGQPYTLADLRQPVALVVGGEAGGAGTEAFRLAEARLHIPMPGGIESLNAGAAAAILLFEVVRQRTQDNPNPSTTSQSFR
jgi:TrmH family RNA methyltransferase